MVHQGHQLTSSDRMFILKLALACSFGISVSALIGVYWRSDVIARMIEVQSVGDVEWRTARARELADFESFARGQFSDLRAQVKELIDRKKGD